MFEGDNEDFNLDQLIAIVCKIKFALMHYFVVDWWLQGKIVP